jgi:hypothetical protein
MLKFAIVTLSAALLNAQQLGGGEYMVSKMVTVKPQVEECFDTRSPSVLIAGLLTEVHFKRFNTLADCQADKNALKAEECVGTICKGRPGDRIAIKANFLKVKRTAAVA